MCETHPDLATVDTGAAQAEPVSGVPPTFTPPTIGAIFRQYGPAYLKKYGDRMSRDQRQVLFLLQRCRTGELGGVLYRCQACGTHHVTPRSCGNRHCPCCQGEKAREWLQQQLDKRLSCHYFFLTFTSSCQAER